ncbi:MAG TPA: glycoside hydrolase family 125 protein [Candidatus Eremiobacteraceae bacterium]|nr:glycoside hydrolase family 125 protein [Candidatus Eremiobacteraceae bacterium]
MAKPATEDDHEGRREAGPAAFLRAVSLAVCLTLCAPIPSSSNATPATTAGPLLPGDQILGLFRTLQDDFFTEADGTTYVQTGDIPAMWLRDSAGQARPYVRFIPFSPHLDRSIRGVIARDAKNILTDSRANAFTAGYKIWEEKWEVDSLAYPIRLAWLYWRTTADRQIFTQRLHWALDHSLQTFECEQKHATCSTYRTRFLENNGAGAPYAYTGMIWGAFRPSDDPVRYPYNIPQEAFAANALDDLAQLEMIGYRDSGAAKRASTLAAQVRSGIERYGEVFDMRYGRIYAYEVDGLGGYELMDDANVPSLLSLPYIDEIFSGDGTYRGTREWVLSRANPYYYSGRFAAGEGSPHTPTGWIWPMGLVVQALTATDASEVRRMLAEIDATRNSDGALSESVNPNDPSQFTRASFGWVNALDAELRFRTFGGFEPQPGSEPTPVLNSPVAQWQYAAQVMRAAELLPMDR